MKPQPRYKKGDKIGGRYLVHQTLMGGMGEVYLCFDVERNLPFALKTFQQRYNTSELRKHFQTEVSTWIALEKHPNIVRCFFMKTIDNQSFMFLEWVAGDESHGTSLRDWLRRGPLTLRLALNFTIDICRGLVHAHQKQPGIVHRDLKPDNVLVSQGSIAKITDFGLAKIIRSANLEASSVYQRHPLVYTRGAGTPLYMAPEQWRLSELDQRTDIYALGCILYELLVGQWVYTAETLAELERQHLEAKTPELMDERSVLNPVLKRCLAKEREGRYTDARELLKDLAQIYRDAFKREPQELGIVRQFAADDYHNRGFTYHNLEQYDRALEDFNQAIDLEPNCARYYCGRGNAYDSLGREQDALVDYAHAIQLDSSDPQTYFNRGGTYAKLRRYEETLADYTQAIELDPQSTLAYRNRGHTYLSLQRYAEALEDYARAILLDPLNAKFYVNRGNAYVNLQRYTEAIADFNQAIALDQKEAKAYYMRGHAFERQQRYVDALRDFSQAIALDPEDSDAYFNRGVTYERLQQYEEALLDYTQAIHLNPKDETAYHNRGDIYNKLQLYEYALADFTQVIAVNPKAAEAYYSRGVVYRKLQRSEEALADYTQAIALDPTHKDAYYNRGAVYDDQHQYETALADYTQVIALDPRDADALFNIGAILDDQGKLQEALSYFEKAAQLGDVQAMQVEVKIRQKLGMVPASNVNPFQQAFEAFQRVSSPDAMRGAVVRCSLLTDPAFIQQIQYVITQHVPQHFKPVFEQRLAWLKQIAAEHK